MLLLPGDEFDDVSLVLNVEEILIVNYDFLRAFNGEFEAGLNDLRGQVKYEGGGMNGPSDELVIGIDVLPANFFGFSIGLH